MKQLVAFAVFISIVNAGCHSAPSFGAPNLFPIFDAIKGQKFIAGTTNGKLYEVVVPNSGGNTSMGFRLLHLYGSPYEMGHAQGELLKDVAPKFIGEVWHYLEGQVENLIPWLPKWLAELVAQFGLSVALDMTYYATRMYTPDHFYDELRGLSDGSGASYNQLVRVHMLAGFTKGACSMVGSWGKANSDSDTLLQLRALDWDMKGPFRDYPQITVYHPRDGNSFVNIGFTGFVGGLTGVSEAGLGISEIGASYPDSSFGEESRFGIPFIFLLRDILQFDDHFDDALNRMTNARRTCNLILGVGDGKIGKFRGFQYSHSVLNMMDDSNLRPANDTWHPKIPNTVYWGMDWECPSYNYVLSQQLKKYHGNFTAPLGIKYLTSVTKSGNNHLAWYDLTNMQLYVAFAASFKTGGPVDAYARQFSHFDLKTLFSEKI